MSTFAISVGRDPDKMRVEETKDNFGIFKTKEEAAQRLVEMVDGRLETLRASRAHAHRILRKSKS